MARIQISNDPSGRIVVSFPYDSFLVAKVKTIDGRRWHPVGKHWSLPKLDGMSEKIHPRPLRERAGVRGIISET